MIPSILRSSIVALVLTAASATATADGPGYPGIYFATDVEQQFRALARRGDGLAFNLGEMPEVVQPTLCKHLQGLARLPGPGTPYLFISRSGNDPGWKCVTGFAPDDPGYLYTVKMGSRETTGERLRSNRLIRNWPADVIDFGGISVRLTKPGDPRDRVTRTLTFNGINWPGYMHPGGMQIVDDVLAIAMEAPYPGSAGPSTSILFVDVSNPEQPRQLSQYPRPGSGEDAGPAGLVGFTPVLNPSGPGLRYLMLTTGGDNSYLTMWLSKSTTGSPDGPTDLRSPNLEWQATRGITDQQLNQCSGGPEWPLGFAAYQSLNFVREGSLQGPLYLVGGRNSGPGGDGPDRVGLFRVNIDPYGRVLGDCPFTFVAERQLTSYPFGGHGDSAALSAAGGTYVSPAGELIVYATEYENDGPFEILSGGRLQRTVRFVEWRNVNVVRDGSPTLRPSVRTAPAAGVDEGSTVTLAATARGPVTKAWIQLFEDDGAGNSLPGPNGDDDWLQVDYDDWDLDNFDSFRRLDAATQTDFDDNAGSWRWFAPAGCTLRANEDPFDATSGVFPGRHSRTLRGNGRVNVERDLDQVRNDAGDATLDDKLSSVQFNGVDGEAECSDYYSATIAVNWDLDGDGSFEGSGTQAAFAATLLDGPTQRVVNVRAQHPTDTTELGRSDPTTVTVTVRNVAPVVAPLEIRDSAGSLVGSTVPFVLTGLPVTVRGSFTDPGRLDRQTAALDWGDGVTTRSAQFAGFTDAFGGATGVARHSRAYAAAGARTVVLTVTDDDADASAVSRRLQVLTPAQALGEIGVLLDALIASTTDAATVRELEAARLALLGSRPPSSQNGALDMIRSGNLSATDAFLRTALEFLQRARAGGADTSTLSLLVRQVQAAAQR